MKCPARLFVLKVDLSQLTASELNHLRSGVDSAIEARCRADDSRRVWTVPKGALNAVELELDES